MNVFVLSTGRSGSLTFARACSHMTNFTAGHETRVPLLGAERLAYPDNHIEADQRLSWLLGRLDEAYGDSAYYIHLTRDPEQVARSWARRFHVLGGIAPAYRDAILANAAHGGPVTRAEAAVDYVATVTANIRLFLKDKSHVMDFAVERAEQDFRRFWNWIGAEGNLAAGESEWSVRHDTETRRTRPKQRLHDSAVKVRRMLFPPR